MASLKSSHRAPSEIEGGRSYRNRFLVGGACPDWQGMVAAGQAECGKPAEYGRVWFWLTRAGAEAALDPGERLCREDFPPPPRSRDASGRFSPRATSPSLTSKEG